jgi:hypothetical protein
MESRLEAMEQEVFLCKGMVGGLPRGLCHGVRGTQARA